MERSSKLLWSEDSTFTHMKIYPGIEKFRGQLEKEDTATLDELFVITDSMASMEAAAKALIVDHTKEWKTAFPLSSFYKHTGLGACTNSCAKD